MPAIIDPATGLPVPSTQPNLHRVPCVCGTINEVEVQVPRFYNLPSTSFVVAEHSGPTMCPGCLRVVAVCIVQAVNVVLRCVPVNANQAVQPVQAAQSEEPTEDSVTTEDPVVN